MGSWSFTPNNPSDNVIISLFVLLSNQSIIANWSEDKVTYYIRNLLDKDHRIMS